MIISIAFLSSCRFIGYWDTVEIQLPLSINPLFEDFGYRWELTYRDSSGGIVVEILPEDCQSVELVLDKGRIFPLSLEAVISRGDLFSFRSKPAGFLYPYDCGAGGQNRFSWEKGFFSDLLLCLDSVLDLEKINLNRLIDEAEEEALGVSLWNLDSRVLLEELATGNFSSYDIRLKRSRQVALMLSAGSWANEDYNGDDLYSLSPAIAVQAELCKGEGRFIHSSGSVLHVFVESDGSFDYIIY